MKYIFLIFSLIPTATFATAMNPELARCYSMKDIVTAHESWKFDYYKMKEDTSLSSEEKFAISLSAAKKIVGHIEALKRLSGLEKQEPLLEEAHRLFRDIENNNITRSSATRVLSSGLGKLIDKMNDLIYKVELKTQCTLTRPPIGVNPEGNF